MIPKTIHYCWFGSAALPKSAQEYILSWKRYCPDYEIKEWNEKNFDINCCDYVKEAYAAKKWAFVSDYVRLKVLVDEGGIYMDTDVEVLRPLDRFLTEKAFSGFETEHMIPTGIMACEKGFPLFKRLLYDYENEHFIKRNKKLDMTTNVVRITKLCKSLGLSLDNTYQTVEGFSLYPKEYFCPKNASSGKIERTNNTYTIHHFAGSWLTEREKKGHKAEQAICRQFGSRGEIFVESLPWKAFKNIYAHGIAETIKKAIRRMRMK